MRVDTAATASALSAKLVELVGTSQLRVSSHLACLRWCGFVTTRREHRVIH